MTKPGKSPVEHDDRTVIDFVREVLDDIRRRLRAGAQGPGATLDADECKKVLACLVDPPYPNSRPPDHGVDARDFAIRLHCARLIKSGVSAKSAVAETALKFGCSKWTVRAARRARHALKK